MPNFPGQSSTYSLLMKQECVVYSSKSCPRRKLPLPPGPLYLEHRCEMAEFAACHAVGKGERAKR